MKIKFSNIVSTLQVGHLSELKKYIYDIVTGELNWFLVKYDLEDIWNLIITLCRKTLSFRARI